MRKLIVVAAMLAMALLVAAPAVLAQTQTNTGDVVSQNVSDQDATQRQYAPGGDAQYNVEGDDDIEVDLETDTIIVDDLPGSGLQPQDDDDFDVVIIDFGDDESEVDTEVDQTGGDGGTQTLDQSNTQNSTATGAAFNAG
jgi:type II secretory pathway pseudopilin PulG